jgi:RNA polymerase sigma-70 factor (ECF subfamily)
MAGVDLQRQQDESLANAELVARSATDEVLVAAAKSGDQLAFVELWMRHSNTAFKIAYRIMGNRDDAEDAIQDAWMKAYVHLKTFDGRAKFSTWLTRIAINSTLMTLRSRRTRRETSMEITDGDNRVQYEITDGKRSVEELCVQHETVEHLRLAIGRLQPTCELCLKFTSLTIGR